MSYIQDAIMECNDLTDSEAKQNEIAKKKSSLKRRDKHDEDLKKLKESKALQEKRNPENKAKNESYHKRKLKESDTGRKLFREYDILVDGRCYETSHTPQRRDEIVPILKQMYPDSKIEVRPNNHYASGYERQKLERIIAKQLKEYGIDESVKKRIKRK